MPETRWFADVAAVPAKLWCFGARAPSSARFPHTNVLGIGLQLAIDPWRASSFVWKMPNLACISAQHIEHPTFAAVAQGIWKTLHVELTAK